MQINISEKIFKDQYCYSSGRLLFCWILLTWGTTDDVTYSHFGWPTGGEVCLTTAHMFKRILKWFIRFVPWQKKCCFFLLWKTKNVQRRRFLVSAYFIWGWKTNDQNVHGPNMHVYKHMHCKLLKTVWKWGLNKFFRLNKPWQGSVSPPSFNLCHS